MSKKKFDNEISDGLDEKKVEEDENETRDEEEEVSKELIGGSATIRFCRIHH